MTRGANRPCRSSTDGAHIFRRLIRDSSLSRPIEIKHCKGDRVPTLRPLLAVTGPPRQSGRSPLRPTWPLAGLQRPRPLLKSGQVRPLLSCAHRPEGRGITPKRARLKVLHRLLNLLVQADAVMLHPRTVSRQGIGVNMYQQVERVRHDGHMNKQPKYRQVADALRREIDNGTYPPGSRLPSESDLSARFDASRNTVRSGLSLLVTQGLITSSQGLGYEVAKHEVFELNASRFENLTFPQNGDAYSTDVTNAGRRPSQTFRVELQPASAYVAERLLVDAGSTTVLRYCHRFVDDVPWSTQATHYPEWLVERGPRLTEPGDIAEGTTRYLASLGITQIGYFDEIATRMPTPEEARLLEIGAGVPVLLWTRTGYSDERPIRCTITTFRGDLNRMNYEIGDLSARSENEPK